MYLNVGLTYGVVCHFWSSPSRSPALTIPTTPWARVDVEVPDLHGLLMASPMPVERLDHFELKPE